MPSYTDRQRTTARQLRSAVVDGLGVPWRALAIRNHSGALALVLGQVGLLLTTSELAAYNTRRAAGAESSARSYAVGIIVTRVQTILSTAPQETITAGSTGSPGNNLGNRGSTGSGMQLGGYFVDPSTGLPAGVAISVRNPATGQLEQAVRDPSNGHFRLQDGSGWVTLSGQFIPSGPGGSGGSIGGAIPAGTPGGAPAGSIDGTGYARPPGLDGSTGSCSTAPPAWQSQQVAPGGTSEHGQAQAEREGRRVTGFTFEDRDPIRGGSGRS